MALSKKIVFYVSILVVVGSFTGCGTSDGAITKTLPKEDTFYSSKDSESNSIFSKDSFGNGYFKYSHPVIIQLLGVGNENENSFEAIGYETNYSGITMFYLKNGEHKIVHCKCEAIEDKENINSSENKLIFSKDSFGDGYFKYSHPVIVQLLGVGNEQEKPFRAIGFETNDSGITMFYLENGERKVVHCDYRVVDDKKNSNSSENTENKLIFSQDSFGNGYFKYSHSATIKLLGVGNETTKPFKVIAFETNSSGVTVFYPEDGGKPRTVHCDYKVLYDK